MKKCSRCEIEKELSEFYTCGRAKDGYTSACRLCINKSNNAWYYKNVERMTAASKKWCAENREKSTGYKKKWALMHPEHEKERGKRRRKEKHEMELARKRKWRAGNRERVRAYDRMLRAKDIEKTRALGRKQAAKRLSTERGRLNQAMSRGIGMSLKGSKARRHWETLVDFTLERLRAHLEKQFLPGMTWENYGQWHIDHKIPKAAFNYDRPEDADFKQCWSIKNLRPMWAFDNISKGAKVDRPFQPSLAIAI